MAAPEQRDIDRCGQRGGGLEPYSRDREQALVGLVAGRRCAYQPVESGDVGFGSRYLARRHAHRDVLTLPGGPTESRRAPPSATAWTVFRQYLLSSKPHIFEQSHRGGE